MKPLISAAAILAAAFATPANAADSAKYAVDVNATWTAKSHPLEYPADAHFSGLIGATHNAKFRLFSDDGTATDGLESLSERGSHAPLDAEIKASIESGSAGALFESGPLFAFPGKIGAAFTTDEPHPSVSVVMMVAPSPDWFTGVSNVLALFICAGRPFSGYRPIARSIFSSTSR